jgi:hypothetical protein
MAEMQIFNSEVASKLDEIAAILKTQGANTYRVRAYRRAAETVRNTSRSLESIVHAEGIAGLDRLPGVGQTIARLLFQLVTTGKLAMLDRLRGLADPLTLLMTVPGIGSASAKMLHDQLGISSLEELEIAAYDGRLAELGYGPKRVEGIRDVLSARLGRIPRQFSLTAADQPVVSEILEVDREYREKALAGELPKIAPRRFNPERSAWLPVLHTSRGAHHYTVMFSNTARAHELAKTAAWVVIYFETDHKQRQYTVVDSDRGVLRGKRIVRGREQECYEFYSRRQQEASGGPLTEQPAVIPGSGSARRAVQRA